MASYRTVVVCGSGSHQAIWARAFCSRRAATGCRSVVSLSRMYAPVGDQGLDVDAANLGRKLAAVVHGWVGEDMTHPEPEPLHSVRRVVDSWPQLLLVHHVDHRHSTGDA